MRKNTLGSNRSCPISSRPGGRLRTPRSVLRRLSLSCALLSLLLAHSADTLSQEDDAQARPRVGLVLAGGGAKGAAHLGVLHLLEELRVPVDCVAGTSMGALIGATFAAGVSPSDIEESVVGIDWTATIGGKGRRQRAPIQTKLAGREQSGGLEFGISNGELQSSNSLVAGQDVEDTIRNLVAESRLTQDFDDLPIPFRAVATDLLAGEMVILESGDLAAAMRASMSLPGFFAPVATEDGRLLADGGLMRNIPIDIARDLCADVVIAVWMSSPQPEADDLGSALSVLERSMGVMIGANEVAQIASLTDSDIGIEVKMGDIATEDFQRVAEAIALGDEAAEQHREELSRFSVTEAQYAAWQQSVRRDAGLHARIDEIRVVGLERVNPEFVRSRITRTQAGSAVSSESITGDLQSIYALGDFERIDYRIVRDGDSRVLEIQPVEKPWGPDFVRLDAGLSMAGSGGIEAILRADHDRSWINQRGGHWHNALQLGSQSILQSDFYQPIDVAQRFFVHPVVYLESELQDIYIEGDRAARYRFEQLYGQVDAGWNIGRKAQLRLGLRHGWQRAVLDTGLPDLPDQDRLADSRFQANFFFDTRDAVRLPTSGTFFRGRYMKSGSWLGGEQDYESAEFVLSKTFTVNEDSLSLIAGGADLISGDLPITELIQLGGIRTFPGLRPGELIGDGFWFAGSTYSWRLADIQPLFGEAIYAGLRIQAGRVYDRFDTGEDDTIYGVAGSLSGRTPIGPFLLSLGYVDISGWRLQFSVGRPISEGSMLDDLQ